MLTLTVRSCTRVFWIGVEKGRVSVRTPPIVFTTDCSFMLYPKMKLTCMQHPTHQHADIKSLPVIEGHGLSGA